MLHSWINTYLEAGKLSWAKVTNNLESIEADKLKPLRDLQCPPRGDRQAYYQERAHYRPEQPLLVWILEQPKPLELLDSWLAREASYKDALPLLLGYWITPIGKHKFPLQSAFEAQPRNDEVVYRLCVALIDKVQSSTDWANEILTGYQGRAQSKCTLIAALMIITSQGKDLEALLVLKGQGEGSLTLAQQLHNAKLLDQADDFFDGATLLQWACQKNDEPLVALLLQAGANPNGSVLGKQGSVLGAYLQNHKLSTTIVRLLLEHGADVKALGEFGQTPLHYLLLNRNASKFSDDAATFLRIIALLLAKGADIHARNTNGGIPLHMLFRLNTRKDHKALPYGFLIFLMMSGKDVLLQDREGHSSLYDAIQKGFEEVVDVFLWMRGSDAAKSIVAAPQQNALYVACSSNQRAIAQKLVAHGAVLTDQEKAFLLSDKALAAGIRTMIAPPSAFEKLKDRLSYTPAVSGHMSGYVEISVDEVKGEDGSPLKKLATQFVRYARHCSDLSQSRYMPKEIARDVDAILGGDPGGVHKLLDLDISPWGDGIEMVTLLKPITAVAVCDTMGILQRDSKLCEQNQMPCKINPLD